MRLHLKITKFWGTQMSGKKYLKENLTTCLLELKINKAFNRIIFSFFKYWVGERYMCIKEIFKS